MWKSNEKCRSPEVLAGLRQSLRPVLQLGLRLVEMSNDLSFLLRRYTRIVLNDVDVFLQRLFGLCLSCSGIRSRRRFGAATATAGDGDESKKKYKRRAFHGPTYQTWLTPGT